MTSFPKTEKQHKKDIQKILNKINLPREQLEKIAIEFANDIAPIKDITCPREVRNPGLYFGFMKAVKLIVGDR